MFKLLKLFVVIGCVGGMPLCYGGDAPVSESAQVEASIDDKDEKSEGWSGFTIFLLVFVFALLFVISSATAMNALGGKKGAPPGRDRKPPQRKKITGDKLPQGKDRFRF
ncbi:MAG: hypothetical protein R6X15_00875 [Pseudomonadota bacterium]